MDDSSSDSELDIFQTSSDEENDQPCVEAAEPPSEIKSTVKGAGWYEVPFSLLFDSSFLPPYCANGRAATESFVAPSLHRGTRHTTLIESMLQTTGLADMQ